jgi:hypothetical protein
MIPEQHDVSIAPEMIRDFIATYDPRDPTDRWIRLRLIELLHGERYRREREYPELVDHGGEA